MDEATPSLPHIPLWRAHEDPYLLLNLRQETMPVSPPVAYFIYRPTYGLHRHLALGSIVKIMKIENGPYPSTVNLLY